MLNREAKRLLHNLSKALIQTPFYGCLGVLDSKYIFPVTERLRTAQRRHTEQKLEQLANLDSTIQKALLEASKWSKEPLCFHYNAGEMMKPGFDEMDIAYTAWIYNRPLLRHRRADCPPLIVEKSWAQFWSEFLEVLAGSTPF